MTVRALPPAATQLTASGASDLILALSISVPLVAALLIFATLLVLFLYRRKRLMQQQEEKWKGVAFDSK